MSWRPPGEEGASPSSPSRVRPHDREKRRDLTRQAKNEAENARVAVRNIRRDAIHDLREFVKEKEITEDDGHRGEDDMQKITDRRIGEIDHALEEKEADLLEI